MVPESQEWNSIWVFRRHRTDFSERRKDKTPIEPKDPLKNLFSVVIFPKWVWKLSKWKKPPGKARSYARDKKVSVLFFFFPLWVSAANIICMVVMGKTLLGRKVVTNLDSIFRSRDITLPTNVRLVKAKVFPVVMYGCESWTIKKKLSTEELMLLNCGVGEDFWESLGLQGDPTSPFWRRSALGFLWKEWC